MTTSRTRLLIGTLVFATALTMATSGAVADAPRTAPPVARAVATGPVTAVVAPATVVVKAMGGRNVMLFVNTSRAEFCTDEQVAYENRTGLVADRVGTPPTPIPPGATPVTVTIRDLGREDILGVRADAVPVEIWSVQTTPDGFGCSATTGLVARTSMDWNTTIASTTIITATRTTPSTVVQDADGRRYELSARHLLRVSEDDVTLRPLVALAPRPSVPPSAGL